MTHYYIALAIVVLLAFAFAGGYDLGRKDRRTDPEEMKYLRSEFKRQRKLVIYWCREAKRLSEKLREAQDGK